MCLPMRSKEDNVRERKERGKWGGRERDLVGGRRRGRRERGFSEWRA